MKQPLDMKNKGIGACTTQPLWLWLIRKEEKKKKKKIKEPITL